MSHSRCIFYILIARSRLQRDSMRSVIGLIEYQEQHQIFAKPNCSFVIIAVVIVFIVITRGTIPFLIHKIIIWKKTTVGTVFILLCSYMDTFEIIVDNMWVVFEMTQYCDIIL
jgi:hypothetical protein